MSIFHSSAYLLFTGSVITSVALFLGTPKPPQTNTVPYPLTTPSLTTTSTAVQPVIKAPTTTPITCPKLIIPAYFYDPSIWKELYKAPRGSLIVLNPNNGPGETLSEHYRKLIKTAQTAGLSVVGYVHTSYGTRPATDVESDITRFKEWYDVDGIFLDEVANDRSATPYYEQLAHLIRSTPGTLVVLNPGAVPDETYIALADVIVSFENTFSVYASTTFPLWLKKYPAHKFAHLIHTSPTSTPSTNLFPTSAHYWYVTDDTIPNPWDRLPTYWHRLLQNLDRVCGTG